MSRLWFVLAFLGYRRKFRGILGARARTRRHGGGARRAISPNQPAASVLCRVYRAINAGTNLDALRYNSRLAVMDNTPV